MTSVSSGRRPRSSDDHGLRLPNLKRRFAPALSPRSSAQRTERDNKSMGGPPIRFA